jgi:phytoene dehydrogenase-like protein
LSHHTVFFPEDYDDEFDAIFQRKEPVPDPAIYICNPQDPLMVKKENSESWFVLINAPRHEPESGCDWTSPGPHYQFNGEQGSADSLTSRGLGD